MGPTSTTGDTTDMSDDTTDLPWLPPADAPPPPPDAPPADSSDAPRPPRPRASRLLAVAVVVAVALASGGIGAAIGAGFHGDATTSPSNALAPVAPGSPSGPSFTPGGSDGGSSPVPDNGSSSGSRSAATVDASGIGARVSQAVVDITTALGEGGVAAGTGMVVTSSGEVLTNYHVIQGATTIRAQVDGAGTTYTAHVLGYDIGDDVALLQLDHASGLKTVSFGDSSKVSVGDGVVAIGNARGRAGPPAVTQGSVSALGRTITAGDPTGSAETLNDMIQVAASIQPGDSGGPLVNSTGKVIGMDTAAVGGFRRFAGPNIGFAIPINRAVSIVHDIEGGHGSSSVHIGPRPLLGVQVQDADDQGESGALVAGVQDGGPAQAAGLQAGDVIVSLGDRSIGNASDLTDAISAYHAGDRVTVGWLDSGGERHRATVKLAAAASA